jgi:hypothetical protein
LINRLKVIAMLFIIFSACPSYGQPGNESINETAPGGQSAAVSNASQPAATPNLSYIWSITGIEDGQVIMLLHQDGSDLYGQAKYEPDGAQSWNGVVVGSVQGDRIYLVITSQKDTAQYTNQLTGTCDPASGSIAGDLLQVKDGQITKRSQFTAMWINPDTASYTPAQVTASGTIEPSINQSSNAATAQAQDSSQTASSKAASSQKSRYHDVREDADRILTGVGDISQIPIGMGGSGLS